MKLQDEENVKYDDEGIAYCGKCGKPLREVYDNQAGQEQSYKEIIGYYYCCGEPVRHDYRTSVPSANLKKFLKVVNSLNSAKFYGSQN